MDDLLDAINGLKDGMQELRERLEYVLDERREECQALKTFHAVVRGRELLRFFGLYRKEIQTSPSGAIELFMTPEKNTFPYEHAAVALLQRDANRQVHPALDDIYNRLNMPGVLNSSRDNLVQELPYYADMVERLTQYETISLILGFPMRRIKRAVESRNNLYLPLSHYLQWRIFLTDGPLMEPINHYPTIYANRTQWPTIKFNPGKCVRDTVVAALIAIDDSKQTYEMIAKQISDVHLFMATFQGQVAPPLQPKLRFGGGGSHSSSGNRLGAEGTQCQESKQEAPPSWSDKPKMVAGMMQRSPAITPIVKRPTNVQCKIWTPPKTPKSGFSTTSPVLRFMATLWLGAQSSARGRKGVFRL
ncbi:hypothetical protein MMC30_005370 [Trapelia coarctata]|nr:hypothetical protein [Trapelia coarctata]